MDLRLTILVVVATSALYCGAATAEALRIRPLRSLLVQPDLSTSDDEATNVSGAACHLENNVRVSCLMIGDEVRYARMFSFDERAVVPGDKVFLLPKKDETGKKLDETDAEGVAYADGFYYIAGSHGLNKSGEKQPSRYFLYRMPVKTVDHSDGNVGSPSAVAENVTRTAALDRILSEVLKATANVAPERGGNNIEGLAVTSGRLFLGFRGPVLAQGALIVEISVTAAFDGPAKSLKLHFVDLGLGQGVRDLAAYENGLLVLSGPQDRQGGAARIYFWNPEEESLKLLAELSEVGSPEHQAEVLMVAGSAAGKVQLLVMEDGPSNGAPRIYEISFPGR